MPAASFISYTLCSMKCASVVAHYYRDYHESQRGAKYITIEIYRALRSPSFMKRRFTWTLIAAAVAVERVARAFSAPLSRIVSASPAPWARGELRVRACFNLPLRWPYPAAHHSTARRDCPDNLHKIGVPSANARSNVYIGYTYMVPQRKVLHRGHDLANACVLNSPVRQGTPLNIFYLRLTKIKLA